VHALHGFAIGIDSHELQTQFPPPGIELRNGPKFRLLSLHSVLTMPAARNPIDTIARQINGHSAMSQKQVFRSEFPGLGFFFMPLSQAFEGPHFTKREISCANCWARHQGDRSAMCGMFSLFGDDFSPVRSEGTESPWRVGTPPRATTDCHL